MAKYSLLRGYANTRESVQKLRKEQFNRTRNWYRDTIPPELWNKHKFNDAVIMKREDLPNDQREFLKIVMSLEEASKKMLEREIKKHELWPWLKQIRGIGPVLAGRLLGRLGDLKRFPTVSHLWSYCGLDGPGWKKRPHTWGITATCWNIAESFQHQPKLSGGYRDIYDARKEYELTRPWCGDCRPKGESKDKQRDKCTDGHMNSKARRYAVKQFLKDLWVVANKN